MAEAGYRLAPFFRGAAAARAGARRQPAKVIMWMAFRACPVCKVRLGEPCVSLSGRVVNGRPDHVAVLLSEPHRSRKMRTGFARGE